MEITCQQRSQNSCNYKMSFTIDVVNTVSTIAVESSNVSSISATDDLSNYQYSVEVDYFKTKYNEIYSGQDPIKKNYDGNDTQNIITE